jgi:hypothetical protein
MPATEQSQTESSNGGKKDHLNKFLNDVSVMKARGVIYDDYEQFHREFEDEENGQVIFFFVLFMI